MARTKKPQVQPVPSEDSTARDQTGQFDESTMDQQSSEQVTRNEDATQQTTGQTTRDGAELRNHIRQRRKTAHVNATQGGHDKTAEQEGKSAKKRGKPKGKGKRGDLGTFKVGALLTVPLSPPSVVTLRLPSAFQTYIHKVAKQVNQELGISKQAMAVMDSMVADMFQRLAGEACNLTHYGRAMVTLGEQQVKTATALILSGDLAYHGKQEADKAMTAYGG
jgi:histone H2B